MLTNLASETVAAAEGRGTGASLDAVRGAYRPVANDPITPPTRD